MITALPTTNRRPQMGLVAFMGAAATMSCDRGPSPIKTITHLLHASGHVHSLGLEWVQPGEGELDA